MRSTVPASDDCSPLAFGENATLRMNASASNIIRIGRFLLGIGLALFAVVCALGCLFAALGGPDGDFGSRDSIQWAIGYAGAVLFSVVLSCLLLRKGKAKQI